MRTANGESAFLVTMDAGELPTAASIAPSKHNAWIHGTYLADVRAKLARRDAWLGGVSEDGLTALFADGWADGASRVRQLADTFQGHLPEPIDVRRRKVWADNGDELDRERLYAGQLDTAWRRTTRVETRAPRVVSVVAAWTHSADVSAEEMFWTGAALVTVTDLLESAGYQIELHALNATRTLADWIAGTLVTVKAAGEPLRMDSVAAVMCHAAPYRVYGMAVKAACPVKLANGYSFGRVIPASTAIDKLAAAGLMDMPFLHCDQMHTRREAEAFIADAVAKLNAATV